MKRILTSLVVLGIAAVCCGNPAFAQQSDDQVVKSFTVSATVPSATSVAIDAYVVINNGTPQLVNGTSLSFDPMTYNTANQIYLPNRYFYVQVTPSGGAGYPTVNVAYTEGQKPAAQTGNGLGHKSVSTFVKTVGNVETIIPSHGKRLNFGLNANVVPSEVTGGYLKVYVGVVTGDPNIVPPEPAGSEVFSNADAPGLYNGSLVFTATLP